MSVPEPLTVKVPPLSVKEPATPTAPISPLLQPEVLDAAGAALFLAVGELVDDGLLDDGLPDEGALLVEDAAVWARGAVDDEVAG